MLQRVNNCCSNRHYARHVITTVLITCAVLASCGDDKPAASSSSAAAGGTTAGPTSSAGAADSGPPATNNENVDCAALKDAAANMTVNWQVIIGLVNAPTTDWADIPLGHIETFPDELATLSAALQKDSQAVGALSYMSDAYDIVQRGLDGDTTAKDDLNTYLGPDASVNINKQIFISLALQNTGCV